MPRRNHLRTRQAIAAATSRKNIRRFAGQPANILVLPVTNARADIEQDCMEELGLAGKCAAGQLTWEDQIKIDLMADEVERIEAS